MNIPEIYFLFLYSIFMIRRFIFNLVGVFRQGIVIELFKIKEIKINLKKKT